MIRVRRPDELEEGGAVPPKWTSDLSLRVVVIDYLRARRQISLP